MLKLIRRVKTLKVIDNLKGDRVGMLVTTIDNQIVKKEFQILVGENWKKISEKDFDEYTKNEYTFLGYFTKEKKVVGLKIMFDKYIKSMV